MPAIRSALECNSISRQLFISACQKQQTLQLKHSSYDPCAASALWRCWATGHCLPRNEKGKIAKESQCWKVKLYGAAENANDTSAS